MTSPMQVQTVRVFLNLVHCGTRGSLRISLLVLLHIIVRPMLVGALIIHHDSACRVVSQDSFHPLPPMQSRISRRCRRHCSSKQNSFKCSTVLHRDCRCAVRDLQQGTNFSASIWFAHGWLPQPRGNRTRKDGVQKQSHWPRGP